MEDSMTFFVSSLENHQNSEIIKNIFLYNPYFFSCQLFLVNYQVLQPKFT